MKVAILAGGQGMRLAEETQLFIIYEAAKVWKAKLVFGRK
jgi:hypothetical protein